MAGPPKVDAPLLRDDLPCLLCSGTHSTVMHRKDPFRIVRCDGCSLVYTLPRLPPAVISQMYQVDYWKSEQAKDFGYTDYLKDADLYLRTFRLRSGRLRRFMPPPARMLDVGCAAGFALQAFAQKGYEVYGVELSEGMAAEAGRRIGRPERVKSGVLARDLFGELRFDLVTFFDVIEHIEDPRALLKAARDLLSERGVIVVETQNVASLFARLLGVHWQHFKFEEHLYHFDPRTIRVLLDQAGFELVDLTARYGGKYVSFDFLVERVGRVHPILSFLTSPLKLLGRTAFYVNVFDEMLVTARARKDRSNGAPASSHG